MAASSNSPLAGRLSLDREWPDTHNAGPLLAQAADELSQRGLNYAAQWALQHLAALPDELLQDEAHEQYGQYDGALHDDAGNLSSSASTSAFPHPVMSTPSHHGTRGGNNNAPPSRSRNAQDRTASNSLLRSIFPQSSTPALHHANRHHAHHNTPVRLEDRSAADRSGLLQHSDSSIDVLDTSGVGLAIHPPSSEDAAEGGQGQVAEGEEQLEGGSGRTSRRRKAAGPGASSTPLATPSNKKHAAAQFGLGLSAPSSRARGTASGAGAAEADERSPSQSHSGQFAPLIRSPLGQLHGGHLFSSSSGSGSGSSDVPFDDSIVVAGEAQGANPSPGALNTPAGSAHVHFAASQSQLHNPSPSFPTSQSLHPEPGTAADPSAGGADISRAWRARAAAARDEAVYRLAKAQFDNHQLERCAWTLEQQRRQRQYRRASLGDGAEAHGEGAFPAVEEAEGEEVAADGLIYSNKALFLQLYAKFLAAERKASEAGSLLPKSAGKAPSSESEIIPLLKHLISPKDPFLLYLKGVIFSRLNKRIEALDCFVRSVTLFPHNWSAWLELDACLGPDCLELSEVADILPISFMTLFFVEAHMRSTQQEDDENVDRVEALQRLFPGSTYLITAKALNFHAMMRHGQAADLFAQALQRDPYSTEGLSEYSHTLHLLQDHGKLAELAHRFSEFGRDDPAVCCLVGNYHNSRGDRLRAVDAFKRAVKLDPSFLTAWVLLGHEYVELRNSHAAAEMYRRALDIDPKHYPSWHGLGQIYELTESFSYSLFYYHKAASLKPCDPRIWLAIGVCYEKMGRIEEAVGAWKRLLACQPDLNSSIGAIERIIHIYERAKQFRYAAPWHRRLVTLVDRSLFAKRQAGSSLPGPPSNSAKRPRLSEVAGDESEDVNMDMTGQSAAAEQQAAADAPPQEGDDTDGNAGPVRTDGSVGGGFGRFARSYIIAAKLEMDMLAEGGGDAQDQSVESASVKRAGNLALAYDYLQKVVIAGTEVTDEAEELLKQLAFRA